LYIPEGVILGMLVGFIGALIGMSLPAPRFRRSRPLTAEQRRDFWIMVAALLVTFAGGIFVHPLFLLTILIWVAWDNYRDHGHIFKP
jgi:hypothetical protein